MTDDHAHEIIDHLRQRRRVAADRVRQLLNELEVAELEFECATRELQQAIENDSEAA